MGGLNRGRLARRRPPNPNVDTRLSWVKDFPPAPMGRRQKPAKELAGPRRPMLGWDYTLERLRDKPGQVAVIARGTASRIQQLHQALRRRPDGGEYRYQTATVDVGQPGQAKLYASYRYEGER